ncbi:unnamed protein product [Brassica rapa subsp. narinosa]
MKVDVYEEKLVSSSNSEDQRNIPFQMYSIKGIDWIASGICEPMLTSKPWLDPSLMGEAKILVEVKQDKSFPRKLALEDQSGSMSMGMQNLQVYLNLCNKYWICEESGNIEIVRIIIIVFVITLILSIE